MQPKMSANSPQRAKQRSQFNEILFGFLKHTYFKTKPSRRFRKETTMKLFIDIRNEKDLSDLYRSSASKPILHSRRALNMVVKVKVSTPSADIPFFVNSFHRNWAQRAGAKIAKSKFSYFRTFLPVLAIKTLQSLSSSKYFDDSKLEVCDRDLVVLLVDISGFTRLSDQFQGLGQAGI